MRRAGKVAACPDKVVGLGLAVLDRVLVVDEFDLSESRLRYRAAHSGIGGMVTNALLQAAKLGCFKDDKPVVAISFAYGVDTRAELIQFVADMSDYVVNGLGANVLFIPMNIIASNDRAGVLKVVEKMERSDAVEVLELPYGYEEVLALLGSVDLVISSRMHLLIFSSITMTPIVGISRVPKTNQYLNFFGLKSLVSTDNLEFSSVQSDLADAWENRDAIKNALQSNREEMFNRSWRNFRLFKDNIVSR